MRRALYASRDRLRLIRDGFEPRAVILLYHRVIDRPIDPLLLAVHPDRFSAHMKIIQEKYHPLSLLDLADALPHEVPDRAVIVTFDDGYADNLAYAAPVVRAADIPATIFVSPGLTGVEAYHDVLEHCLLTAPNLPEKISLRMGGGVREWNLGEWKDLPADPGSAYWAWNSQNEDLPSPRHRAYLDIFRLLRPMGKDERDAVLAELRRIAGVSMAACADHRYLSVDELKAWKAGGRLEIGAHTMNHLVLGKRSPEEQFAEIGQSKHKLERQLGAPVTTFAYPYGSAWDVSPLTVAYVQKAGFRVALANQPGPVTRLSDPFWLPRCGVRNWTCEEFERRLDSFFQPAIIREPVG